MINKQYEIKFNEGINTKLAEAIVEFISNFECDIFLTHNNAQINMKSIMGFISLIITAGSIINITYSGTDEEAAAIKLEKYLIENEII